MKFSTSEKKVILSQNIETFARIFIINLIYSQLFSTRSNLKVIAINNYWNILKKHIKSYTVTFSRLKCFMFPSPPSTASVFLYMESCTLIDKSPVPFIQIAANDQKIWLVNKNETIFVQVLRSCVVLIAVCISRTPTSGQVQINLWIFFSMLLNHKLGSRSEIFECTWWHYG